MNYNLNYHAGQLPGPMVFHPKYGYVEPRKLPVKKLRTSLSSVSVACICMLAASVLFSTVIGLIFGLGVVDMDPALYPETGGIPTQIYYAMNMFLVPLTTGLTFVIYLCIKKEPLADVIRTEKTGFGTALMLIIAGGGLCLAANFPSMLLGSAIESVGLDPGYSETPPVKDVFSAVTYFLGVAVMPAIFEEFAFRGIILGSLRKYGKWFALVMSAIIFGSMHLSATSILFATIAGFVMGYVYLLTNNIWVNVGIHFMNNCIAVILDIASANLGDIAYAIVNVVLFYVPIIAAVVLIVLLIIFKKLRLPDHPQQEVCTVGNKFTAVFTSAGFISFVVLIAAFVVMSLFVVM